MPLNNLNPHATELEASAKKIYEKKQHLSSLFQKNGYNSNPEELEGLEEEIRQEESLLTVLQTEYYDILRKYAHAEKDYPTNDFSGEGG